MSHITLRSASNARLLSKKNFLTIVTAILIVLSAMPTLFAQSDVHATLIASSHRKPAPSIHLMSNAGKLRRLSDFRGKVVLLNFWATDCGGCVLEIPSIISIASEFKNRDFTVVGLSMDIPYDGLSNAKQAWDKVNPFALKRKIDYPILMGNESLYKRFGLTQLPDTLLIDKAGRVAAVYVGIISQENVEANIRTLLSEQ